MSPRKKPDPGAPFRAFARHFCSAFGAEAVERQGRLHVTLPPDAAAHFGQPEVVWSFTPHDPEGELVAYGSRAFEEMLAYLGGRGRCAGVRLPARPTEPPTVAPPETLQSEADVPERCHVFNFQLAFSCDERVERLFEVALGEDGREQVPVLEGELEETPPAPIPPDLLRRAEDRAIAAAEAWSAPMEKDALSRLQAVGERLVSYYEGQMREVPVRRKRGQSEDEAAAEAEEVIWRLRRELEHKLRDETARHHMRIQVRRIGQLYVETPGTRRTYRLPGPNGARELVVWTNRHTGSHRPPPCERCGEPGARYAVCADQHLVCTSCLGACEVCATPHCRAELHACPTCRQAGCTRCQTACVNGHRGCSSHLTPCPGCGQALCPACERPHACILAQ